MATVVILSGCLSFCLSVSPGSSVFMQHTYVHRLHMRVLNVEIRTHDCMFARFIDTMYCLLFIIDTVTELRVLHFSAVLPSLL